MGEPRELLKFLQPTRSLPVITVTNDIIKKLSLSARIYDY